MTRHKVQNQVMYNPDLSNKITEYLPIMPYEYLNFQPLEPIIPVIPHIKHIIQKENEKELKKYEQEIVERNDILKKSDYVEIINIDFLIRDDKIILKIKKPDFVIKGNKEVLFSLKQFKNLKIIYIESSELIIINEIIGILLKLGKKFYKDKIIRFKFDEELIDLTQNDLFP